MNKKLYINWWLPFVFFFLMLLDGQLSFLMRMMVQSDVTLNFHLLLLAIIVSTFYCKRSYLIILTIVIGFLYDSYYYGILGIQMLALPLIVLLAYAIFSRVEPSFLSLFVSLIIFNSIMEFTVFFLQIIFKLIVANPTDFVVEVLGPTLLLNSIVFILLYYPMKKMISASNNKKKKDKYSRSRGSS